jgi:hypothetical protein
MISSLCLNRTHSYYMDTWAWEFAYPRWNVAALQETLFWYAASGQAISHESTTARWWKLIKTGRAREIDAPPARKRWADIQRIAPELRAIDTRSAFGWFLSERSREAWEVIQKVKYVGPKIASWLLRDISLLRDYATENGDHRAQYSYPERRRDSAWFTKLRDEEQAVFQPLDRWVIRGAQALRIIPHSATIERVQGNCERYLETASAIASWARAHARDARDVNIYWYLTGSKTLTEDGLCPARSRDEVWWCYEGADRVNRNRDWLIGNVVKRGLVETVVSVKKQLRDPRTRAVIQEKHIAVPHELLRWDE